MWSLCSRNLSNSLVQFKKVVDNLVPCLALLARESMNRHHTIVVNYVMRKGLRFPTESGHTILGKRSKALNWLAKRDHFRFALRILEFPRNVSNPLAYLLEFR